jgi:NAD(P)-dependent dehydrogenase (short-subunit alcohol dehydrogenase family)
MGDRLARKVAVVTGAASGIGLASVELMAGEGAQVFALDVQDAKGAALEARFPGRVRYAHCDVTKPQEIRAGVDAAATCFGGLDILFNNAGAVGGVDTLQDMDLESWDRTHALLLRSVVAGTTAALPHLAARGGGAVINTASIAGLQAGWGPICYSTMKAAVIHFTRVAAAELSKSRIRINAICPGFIATSIFGGAIGLPVETADQMAAMLEQRGGAAQPAGRVGRPHDIAEMAVFLASDAAEFVTGAHFVVDGGITIGPRHAWDDNAASPFLEAMGVTPEQLLALQAARKTPPQT